MQNIERDLSTEDITPCFKRRASYVRHLTLYPLAERQITYSGYLEAIPVYGDGVAMRHGSPLCVSWKDFVVFTRVIQGMTLFKNLQSLELHRSLCFVIIALNTASSIVFDLRTVVADQGSL